MFKKHSLIYNEIYKIYRIKTLVEMISLNFLLLHSTVNSLKLNIKTKKHILSQVIKMCQPDVYKNVYTLGILLTQTTSLFSIMVSETTCSSFVYETQHPYIGFLISLT